MPMSRSLRPNEKPGVPRSTMSRLRPRLPFAGSVTARMTSKSTTLPSVTNAFPPLIT